MHLSCRARSNGQQNIKGIKDVSDRNIYTKTKNIIVQNTIYNQNYFKSINYLYNIQY